MRMTVIALARGGGLSRNGEGVFAHDFEF